MYYGPESASNQNYRDRTGRSAGRMRLLAGPYLRSASPDRATNVRTDARQFQQSSRDSGSRTNVSARSEPVGERCDATTAAADYGKYQLLELDTNKVVPPENLIRDDVQLDV
jgi:hypothetical protein